MLANIRPSGAFLMEDFYYAGGLRALMTQIEDLLHLDAITVNGCTLGANLAGREVDSGGRHPAKGESGFAIGRNCDPIWESRSRRRGDQAVRCRSSPACGTRARRSSSRIIRTWRRSSIARIWP